MAQRKGGIIQFKVGGVQHNAKGNFSYNLGSPKREAIIGADGVHGYTEKPQAAFIEGEITDHDGLDLRALTTVKETTVTLLLAVGKTIVLPLAWYAGEGTGNSEEGNIAVRFESASGEEI